MSGSAIRPPLPLSSVIVSIIAFFHPSREPLLSALTTVSGLAIVDAFTAPFSASVASGREAESILPLASRRTRV